MGSAFVFEVVLLFITGCFGVLGNCLLIKTFVKLEEKVNFHHVMITLAIFDTIYILLCIIVFAMPEMLPESYKTEGYDFYIAPKAVAMLQVALTGSIYCTVSISLERYLTVCHPFYSALKNWTAKRYIIPIVLFSVIYNVTRFFEIRIKYTEYQQENVCNITKNNETFYNHAHENQLYNATSLSDDNNLVPYNSTLQNNNCSTENISRTTEYMKDDPIYNYEFELTELRKNKYYYIIYIVGLSLIFNGLIPFAVIISLNVLLYRQLKTILANSTSHFNPRSSSSALHHYCRSSSLSSSQPQHQRSSRRNFIRRIQLSEIELAKVSIAIVVVFVICHSVKWIPNIYELLQRLFQDIGEEDIAWPLWVQYNTEISHLLTVLNSSANFYIYYITHYGMPTISCLSRNPEATSSPDI